MAVYKKIVISFRQVFWGVYTSDAIFQLVHGGELCLVDFGRMLRTEVLVLLKLVTRQLHRID